MGYCQGPSGNLPEQWVRETGLTEETCTPYCDARVHCIGKLFDANGRCYIFMDSVSTEAPPSGFTTYHTGSTVDSIGTTDRQSRATCYKKVVATCSAELFGGWPDDSVTEPQHYPAVVVQVVGAWVNVDVPYGASSLIVRGTCDVQVAESADGGNVLGTYSQGMYLYNRDRADPDGSRFPGAQVLTTGNDNIRSVYLLQKPM